MRVVNDELETASTAIREAESFATRAGYTDEMRDEAVAQVWSASGRMREAMMRARQAAEEAAETTPDDGTGARERMQDLVGATQQIMGAGEVAREAVRVIVARTIGEQPEQPTEGADEPESEASDSPPPLEGEITPTNGVAWRGANGRRIDARRDQRIGSIDNRRREEWYGHIRHMAAGEMAES